MTRFRPVQHPVPVSRVALLWTAFALFTAAGCDPGGSGTAHIPDARTDADWQPADQPLRTMDAARDADAAGDARVGPRPDAVPGDGPPVDSRSDVGGADTAP